MNMRTQGRNTGAGGAQNARRREFKPTLRISCVAIALALLFMLALACGGEDATRPSRIAPSPEITIQFLDETPVVQPGYAVGFRARTVGISDLSALEWSVSAGEIDRLDADRMWWWPPNGPDGEEYTITASFGEYSGSKTVTLRTVMPPPWADEVEISLYVFGEVDSVQSGWTAKLTARPANWYDHEVDWEVTAGNVEYRDNSHFETGHYWKTPDTDEDLEVTIAFVWRGIALSERRVAVKGTQRAFYLFADAPEVVVEPTWMGDDMYDGYWWGNMWTPDHDGCSEFNAIYVASLENWEPHLLPAQASLQWSDWNLWNCKVEVLLTQEKFNTLLPTAADFVVRRYATEEDRQAGIVLWEDKLPLAFVAYSAD